MNESLVRKFISEDARTTFWVVVEFEFTFVDVEIRHHGRYWSRRRILSPRGGKRKWTSVSSALAWLYKEGVQHAQVDMSQWQPGKIHDGDETPLPEQQALGF